MPDKVRPPGCHCKEYGGFCLKQPFEKACLFFLSFHPYVDNAIFWETCCTKRAHWQCRDGLLIFQTRKRLLPANRAGYGAFHAGLGNQKHNRRTRGACLAAQNAMPSQSPWSRLSTSQPGTLHRTVIWLNTVTPQLFSWPCLKSLAPQLERFQVPAPAVPAAPRIQPCTTDRQDGAAVPPAPPAQSRTAAGLIWQAL